jgi:4-diphosphocytidyl-2-C-methyl-D-erythritol kinase
MIKVKANAKINLYLNILGKRKDNYHNISSIIQNIDLGDDIIIFKKKSGIKVICDDYNVPLGEDNLIYKSAKLLIEKFFELKSLGVLILLKKRIPIASGLGGGSADAASTLIGINKLLKLNLSDNELLKMGSSIGSDIPFFLVGGTAIVEGKGEKITPLVPLIDIWVVLAKPDFQIITKDIYDEYDKIGKPCSHDISEFMEYFGSEDLLKKFSILENSLEKIVEKKYKIITVLKKKALESGALASIMTGGGPAVVSLCEDFNSALKVYTKLSKEVDEVYVAKTCSKGSEII